MTLRELFAPYAQNLPDTPVLGITQNSKEVGPGFVFFAVNGHTVDGHDFIEAGIARGAVAVVTQQEVEEFRSVPVIKVQDINASMADIACRFYGNPSEGLNVIGITGTKGKTSISYLIESILFSSKKQPSVFGTINYRVNGDVISKASNTTPPALSLQKMIRQAADAGSTDLVMEVSSHAMELKRVEGINFNIAVFTNLQRDHLDFHTNFDNYFAAKRKLFENLLNPKNIKQKRTAVINIDDPYGHKLVELLKNKVKVLTYSLTKPADFVAKDIVTCLNGVSFKVNGEPARINLLGEHNVYNALAAIAVAHKLGIHEKVAIKGLENLKGVPGRMERVDLGQNFYVFVDFAYTNEAMVRAFDAVAPFKEGKITMVFGCGGQRDVTKRPLMGATAARNSDLALVTKDNPRKEDSTSIFINILEGMKGFDNFKVIPDRREAIFEAIKRAGPKDIVIIAGKGHEDYQILPTGIIHFSDRETAEEAIKKYVYPL
jgi:UDP-N-acetylmuramoyl-L-alanyl-D-glutamate--2,6-diaminopimelate ligase